ncbi:SusD/RagB family nutrient-binding outer membrane lipoprotein [Puia sp. P3]|uniref:SusD/RagB family nutrient-binding outer membrane lipoprotein n=1 Tax=Puia sp. P3 TaxID=3423952 RepID=UPI003D666980
MKQLTTVILLLSLAATSCTKDFQTMNTDPNNTPNALPQQLLAPALVNTLTYNMTRNRGFNNELMQVTVNLSDAEGQPFRYDIPNSYSDYLYNGWYSQLTNFKDIYKISSVEPNYNKSYMGISLICQSWIYSMLTDTYGNVPYFHSNQAKDSADYQPAFDAQKDIYFDIFRQLDTANSLLSANTAIIGASDPVYNGNIARWRKFGNSLYLRLLLRIAGKSEVADTCIKKFQYIVANQSSYPLIDSIGESAILRWTGVAPLNSPYLSVREQDFRTPAICSFFIDHLSNWSDPRIDGPTWGVNNINRWDIAPYSGQYIGVPSGYSPGTGQPKKCYFYSTTSTSTLMTDPLTGMMLNYGEAGVYAGGSRGQGLDPRPRGSLLRQRGIGGIHQWLPNYNVPITTYLGNADMQWDESASFDDKMEKIQLQKYYILFLEDMQQVV